MKLFLSEEIDPFFNIYQFYGLTSNVKPAKLCWLLQNYLNQDFTRDPETDIPVLNVIKAPRKPLLQTLFDQSTANKDKKEWSFHALIKIHFSSTQKTGYIYQNKINQSILIPELANFDYIFASSLSHQNDKAFIKLLKLVPSIHHIHTLDIYEIQSKNNLLL